MLTTRREREKFKIFPTDVARLCYQIGLDRRKLGFVKEEGEIVDHGFIFLYFLLENRNESNNGVALLSYKEVNIPFVSKLLDKPCGPTSSSN